jgi:hypothetical protein
VRRVAWNLATSRWRRARVAARFARAHADRAERAPSPGPERVALAAALANLPAQHRRAGLIPARRDRQRSADLSFQVVFAMPAGVALEKTQESCAGPPPGYWGGDLACGGTVEPGTSLALRIHFTRIDGRRQTTPVTVHVGYTDPQPGNNDAAFTFQYR